MAEDDELCAEELSNLVRGLSRRFVHALVVVDGLELSLDEEPRGDKSWRQAQTGIREGLRRCEGKKGAGGDLVEVEAMPGFFRGEVRRALAKFGQGAQLLFGETRLSRELLQGALPLLLVGMKLVFPCCAETQGQGDTEVEEDDLWCAGTELAERSDEAAHGARLVGVGEGEGAGGADEVAHEGGSEGLGPDAKGRERMREGVVGVVQVPVLDVGWAEVREPVANRERLISGRLKAFQQLAGGLFLFEGGVVVAGQDGDAIAAPQVRAKCRPHRLMVREDPAERLAGGLGLRAEREIEGVSREDQVFVCMFSEQTGERTTCVAAMTLTEVDVAQDQRAFHVGLL